MAVIRVEVPVETRAPTGATNAYVLGDGSALLVDPPAASDRLDEVVTDREVGHVAVTHHHPDHLGAVERYATETDATVWARAGRVKEFTTATGLAPDRTFSEGTRIETGEEVVHVHAAPGHAPEHVAFRTDRGLVCGDLAVAEGSVVVGAPEGDMRAYLTSLRRVHAMNPQQLCPGHGPIIEGDEVRAVVRRLIDHRLDRERRVQLAVEEGASTVSEIVGAAYDTDLSGVRDLAAATVRAHLEKLSVEGRVRWDGERATPE